MTNSNLLTPRQTEESAPSITSSTPTPTIHTPSSEDASQDDSIASKPRSQSPRDSLYGSKIASKSSVSLPVQPTPSRPQEYPSEGRFGSDQEFEEEEEEEEMEDRPPMHRPTDGRSHMPLLKVERGRPSYDGEANTRPGVITRRSTFRSRSPDMAGASATRRKYTYAAFFLILSLISFVIQTETAVYIQHELGWKKPYCML